METCFLLINGLNYVLINRSLLFNVWTPAGSIDASAKRCEAASMFSHREYSVYVLPFGSLDIKIPINPFLTKPTVFCVIIICSIQNHLREHRGEERTHCLFGVQGQMRSVHRNDRKEFRWRMRNRGFLFNQNHTFI